MVYGTLSIADYVEYVPDFLKSHKKGHTMKIKYNKINRVEFQLK